MAREWRTTLDSNSRATEKTIGSVGSGPMSSMSVVKSIPVRVEFASLRGGDEPDPHALLVRPAPREGQGVPRHGGQIGPGAFQFRRPGEMPLFADED